MADAGIELVELANGQTITVRRAGGSVLVDYGNGWKTAGWDPMTPWPHAGLNPIERYCASWIEKRNG